MSIYDKASLVLIPSGSKTSKVYSQKPVSGDGDFTFSRSTAATRVNASGNIEKETSNLLLQSNSFDTTWLNDSSVTHTSGQSGYDGSNDAWLITKGAFTYQKLYQDVTASGLWTFSIYAKEGTLSRMTLRVHDNGARVIFDLSDGSVTNFLNVSSTLVDYGSSDDLGSGWRRYYITCNVSITRLQVYPDFGEADAGNIYIQDAQLEQGLVARDYIETTTTAIYGGITDNVPRLDYQGSCPALLLEPQRTNVWKHSEYVSGNHLVGPPTITENYAESPEGLNNAFRIQDTTGTSFKRIAESSGGLSVSVNSTYTQSLFVKKATSAVSSNGGVGFDYSGGTRQISYIIFDEYNGTMTALQSQSTLTLHDAEDYGDYWRFSITAKDTGNNTNLSLNVYACLSGNGTSVSLGTKDWTGYGLQLEAGSYATSYIPTYGSAVTRNADSLTLLSMSNNITSGVSAASLFVNYEYTLNSLNDAFCFGQNNNFYPAGRGYIYSTGNGFADSFGGGGFSITQGADTKTIWRLNTLSNTNIFQNGVKGSTRNGDAWAKVDQITFRGAFGTIRLKEMILFNSAISDQEAIDLTTI